MDLEARDLGFQCGASGEQSGNHHHGSQMCRNAVVQRETGQGCCTERPHDGAIHECDGDIQGRNQTEESEQHQVGAGSTPRVKDK